MRFSKLDDWLSWQETLHPKKIDLSLDRVREVLGRMELRRPDFRVLTIAGTNGKGSSVALLDSILTSAGYKVGAFTSPHLRHYRERIRRLGTYPSDSRLVELFDAVDRHRKEVSLTYFEFGTLAAMLEFADQGVQVALLEVGLGGRLDATNAVESDGAMVVSIGLDHTRWLGNDRETIAVEKAGVFRAGRPGIIAEPDPPRSLITEARRKGTQYKLAGEHFRVLRHGDCWDFEGVDKSWKSLPAPAMAGDFQYQNAAGVLALLAALRRKIPVPQVCIERGLTAWSVPGRLQRFELGKVHWLLDVTHNAHGANALAQFLNQQRKGHRIAVVGLMSDKDHAAIFSALESCFDRWILVGAPTPRSANKDELQQALKEAGVEASDWCDSPRAGCDLARRLAKPGDQVVVLGSFYVVGPALEALELYSRSSQEGA